MTERHWTTLANLASPRKSLVDSRGLVLPWGKGWSLDWWVGADDRWHFPGRDDGIRQRLVSLTPVVETAMRVPGGDAVHRVYAVRGAGRSDELLVIEVENQSPAPFALAWTVQPGDPKGAGAVGQIDLVERTVMIDGWPALYLAKRPSRYARFRPGEADPAAPELVASLASLVESGAASEDFVTAPPDPAGAAEAAFLYPLAHTASIRVAIPLVAAAAQAGRPSRSERRRWLPPPESVPAAADAARAWQAQTRRGLSVELPPGRLADAIEANRRFLLLSHAGATDDELLGGQTLLESALRVVALDRWGFHDEAAETIRGYPALQRRDGRIGLPRAAPTDAPGANGAILWAIGEHRRLRGDGLSDDGALLRSLVPMIAAGAGWIERRRHGSRRDAPALSYPDSLWSLRGLLDAAEVLRAAGEDEAAATAAAWATAWRVDADASLVIPLAADGAPSAAIMAILAGCSPLGLDPPTHPAMVAAGEAIRSRFCDGAAVVDTQGGGRLAALLTLQLAGFELCGGDRRALKRLAWVVESASDTWTWPGAIEGHDPATTAEFCSLVRNLLVREVPGGLAIFSLLPEEWWGQAVEVHDAPTAAGPLSFAIRWHGERPALLWELRPCQDSPVRFRAPGLDPRWTSVQPSGDALLDPIAGAPPPAKR